MSKDFGNVVAQLKSGKTRGSNPRDLEPEELVALEQKRDALKAKMQQSAKERAVARINGHTTAQADRVVKAVQDAAAPANAYFSAIGGAGSSADARGQERQQKREQADQRRATKKAEWMSEKAAVKEKADVLRQLSTTDLRVKLDAAGADSRGSKAVLVRRLARAAAPSAAKSAGPHAEDATVEDNAVQPALLPSMPQPEEAPDGSVESRTSPEACRAPPLGGHTSGGAECHDCAMTSAEVALIAPRRGLLKRQKFIQPVEGFG